jgi:hypothetical protein
MNDDDLTNGHDGDATNDKVNDAPGGGWAVPDWGVGEPPAISRVRDLWLGGLDNFKSDRVAGGAVTELAPWMAGAAKVSRAFLSRAVTVMAKAGVDQFLDLGCGLPYRRGENVHEIAQRARGTARVVYVDNDRVVMAHARARLAIDPQTIAIDGDARELVEILTDPRLLESRHLDWTRPVGVLMIGLLDHLNDAEAMRAVRVLRQTCAPGSYLAIAHATADPAVFEHVNEVSAEEAMMTAINATIRSHSTTRKRPVRTRTAGGVIEVVPAIDDIDAAGWHRATLAAAEAYRRLIGPLYPRSWEQIRGFLDGYDLTEAGPGLVGVDLWQPRYASARACRRRRWRAWDDSRTPQPMTKCTTLEARNVRDLCVGARLRTLPIHPSPRNSLLKSPLPLLNLGVPKSRL